MGTTDLSAVRGELTALADQFSGRVGVAAFNINTGEHILLHADDIFPIASVIKVPILVELFKQAHDGAFSLEERVQLQDGHLIGGSGILKLLDVGLHPTIRDLATLMIVLSDNTATNILIDRVGGVATVNKTMHDFGLDTIVLPQRIEFRADNDDVRRIGEASPRDLATLVAMVARQEVLDRESCEAILGVMGRQHYLDQVPRYLDFNPYAADFPWLNNRIKVACKTGFLRLGVRADIGLLELADNLAIAYCVATADSSDNSFSPEHEGAVVAGLVGRLLVQYWWKDAYGPSPLLDTRYVGLLT